jgi:hypothetical protein
MMNGDDGVPVVPMPIDAGFADIKIVWWLTMD